MLRTNNYVDKSALELIKDKVLKIYEDKIDIHVNVVGQRRKIHNAKTKITGVFEKFFCVKSYVNNYEEEFTISYVDILCKNFIIKEIETIE